MHKGVTITCHVNRQLYQMCQQLTALLQDITQVLHNELIARIQQVIEQPQCPYANPQIIPPYHPDHLLPLQTDIILPQEQPFSTLKLPSTLPLQSSQIRQLPSNLPVDSLSPNKDKKSSPRISRLSSISMGAQPDHPISLFALTYDPDSQRYTSTPITPNATLPEIAPLLLGTYDSHLTPIAHSSLSSSLAAPPRVWKPIIIPIANPPMYALVFQTIEYLQLGGQYMAVDRFWVFLSERFAYKEICDLAKYANEKEFGNRYCLGDADYMLDPARAAMKTRVALIKEICQEVDRKNKKGLIGQEEQENNKYLYLKKISNQYVLMRLYNLHYQKLSLLAVLLFYAIRQGKIVLVGDKENRRMLSEAVMVLREGLRPLQYPHPTILCTITQLHLNYLDTPVPCMVGYWGPHGNVIKNTTSHIINSHSPTPTVLIDVNNLTITSRTPSKAQSQQLLSLHNRLTQKKKVASSAMKETGTTESSPRDQDHIIDRSRQYIRDLLSNEDSSLHEQAAILRESSIYHTYRVHK